MSMFFISCFSFNKISHQIIRTEKSKKPWRNPDIYFIIKQEYESNRVKFKIEI